MKGVAQVVLLAEHGSMGGGLTSVWPGRVWGLGMDKQHAAAAAAAASLLMIRPVDPAS